MTSAPLIRILYLEDSEADAELVQALLEEGGIACALTRVETEEAFTAVLESGELDLILSDKILPAYDGLSALVRARQRRPEVPFILVSGTLGDEEAVIETLKAGVTDYVPKERLARLVPVVQRALQEAEARAARQRYEARVQQLAFYDGLTGLPNRALLEDRLRMALAHAQRSEQGVALLFLDLDRFKAVNDTLGHPAGDVLLREVAERLPRCLREGDTAARWGGDEFIVLVPDLPGKRPAAAEAVAVVIEKIREVLSGPVKVESQEFEISMSIGVALYPGDGASVTDLIKNADTAMYQAKDKGRNTYRFFTEDMHTLARERLFLENELRRALRRSEFTLHYQPQVKTRGGVIVGAEALLRWRHPDRGWISPAEFVPVAEDIGQIQTIGTWALDHVLAQINTWRAMGLRTPHISVNVSAHQLKDQAFARTVEELLAAHALPPECLELEFTESAMVQEETLSTVCAIARLGVTLAVDDFGTGYSSLNYLKRFPIDTLKIDQSFVRDLESDPNDAALIRAIIAMARSLQLRVIAEGVETEPQRLLLSKYGCLEYQGFLFSPPVPAEAFTARLQGVRSECEPY
ncbi:MAG: EAL domain-containing protein [Pseudomonadota bacterium]|jgi:diguanylate cyclase (GGDEF)-like protein|nr:EAL domain-containing protein [Pseudomonadota bacterium]